MNSFTNMDIVFVRDTNRAGNHLGLPQGNHAFDVRTATGTKCVCVQF